MRRSLKSRTLLLSLVGLFAAFEAANFTGFSLSQLRRPSDAELISAAIQYRYRGTYSNSADLKRYYSSFDPEVYYWQDLTGEAGSQFLNKLFGFKQFQIRLPDAVVVVSADAKALFSRTCCENRLCGPAVLPDHTVLGIVGTVQEGPPNYEVANNLSVTWEDSIGTVLVSGHCFAAFSSAPHAVLRISAPFNTRIIRIGDEYGYRLVAITDVKRGSFKSMNISDQGFVRSQTCDEAARAAWPNVGGDLWKR